MMKGEQGFTLIEILIVLMVTMVALAGLLGLYGSTAHGNRLAGQSGEAVEVAEETMEGLRSSTTAAIEARYGAVTTAGWGPIAHLDGPIVGRNGVVFHRRVSAIELAAASSNLIRLEVEVAWDEHGGDPEDDDARDHRVTLELVRTRGELL